MADRAADPIDVTLLVAGAIERAGGAYFVGGSLASSLQGEPRATNDVDVVVELPLGRIGTFVKELGAEFEVDVEMLREALLHGGSCNIFHLPTVLKVDLFAVGPTPFDEMEFSRRKAVRVREGSETLVLKSPEDTVLRKLRWYEDGGRVSERQWRDIVQVLRVSGGGMDPDYLDRWAAMLDVTALLQRARQDATSAL
ncbi:MAG TPA: hypothetical protein VGK52_12680 [Polyangia bacterium]|jgi:hypothetical protein